MAWRVLLLGSPGKGLAGVADDVSRMREALIAGYRVPEEAIEAIVPATRVAIVDGFRRLIEQVEGEGDRVFVYYSGHGTVRGAMGCLVPVDFEASTVGDFRGVLAAELGLWFAEILSRTRYVTWVVDCCHAAETTRGSGSVAGALRAKGVFSQAQAAAFDAHIKQIAEAARGLDAQVDPRIVRVCAAAGHERAYEGEFAGKAGGLLTHALAECLETINHRAIRCTDLHRRVQARIGELMVGRSSRQTVTIAGPPGAMWLFEPPAGATEPRRMLATGLRTATSLIGGRMLGQRRGDCYAVVGLDGELFAEVEVTEVWSDGSTIAVVSGRPWPGLTAVLGRAGSPRGVVTLVADAGVCAALVELLAVRGYAGVAADGVAGERPRVGHVEIDVGAMRLTNWLGERLEDARTLAEVGERVEDLARVRALIDLRAEDDALLPEESYRVVWEAGARTLEIGATGLPVYVSAFHASADGEVRQLNRRQPGGVKVRGLERIACAADDLRARTAHPGWIVVFVSDCAVDVRGWVLDEVSRQESSRGGSGVRFAVRVIDLAAEG